MPANQFNIYLTGVGGQGIGLISEIVLRAADHAGHKVKAVDTHGLAQRGGIVVSQVRMGNGVYTPLIPRNGADLVVALERHEALRATNGALKDKGALVYYDTVWQPLAVRLDQGREVDTATIETVCQQRQIKVHQVFDPKLDDPRMQNIAVLAVIDRHNLIPKIDNAHYRAAMEDLMAGSMLQMNMALFTKTK